MRRTRSLVLVAVALMDDPFGSHWGYDLSKRSGVASGVMYPILHRLLAEGLLSDGWDSSVQGSPPRRYYYLTDRGRIALGGVLADAAREARFTGIPGLAR